MHVMTPGAPSAARVTWAMVEDGFYVGTRDGEYLGYVDRQASGEFVACNAHSRPVGRYPDLAAAIDALAVDEKRSAPESNR